MDITNFKPSIYNVHVLSTNKTDHITINGIPTNSFALDVTDPLEITVTGKTHVHVTINGEEIIPKYSHVVDYHTIGNYVQGDTWRFYCGPSYWEWHWNMQGLGKIF